MGAAGMRRSFDAARRRGSGVFKHLSSSSLFCFCISAAQDSAAVRRRDPAPSTREGSLLRPLLVMAAGFVLASHCAAACPVGVFLCVSAQRAAVLALGLCVGVFNGRSQAQATKKHASTENARRACTAPPRPASHMRRRWSFVRFCTLSRRSCARSMRKGTRQAFQSTNDTKTRPNQICLTPPNSAAVR